MKRLVAKKKKTISRQYEYFSLLVLTIENFVSTKESTIQVCQFNNRAARNLRRTFN